MTRKLHISDGLALPVDAVTQAMAILARRGAGKTHTATVLVEEVIDAKVPVVVIDPTGAWFGLRSSKDGKSPGLPVVIIGGEHGDVPLESTAGKVIADVVVEHPGPYVIDLSAFESNAAQERFATDFAERLYRAKANKRDALLLVVDEADSFAPQRPQPGEQRMLGAFEAIVRRGRIRGLGVVLISQRTAVLNKNVLSQVEVLIALQTTSPHDRAAVESWVEGNGSEAECAEVLGSLASLARGEAWIWSPSWLRTLKRVRIRDRNTFDSSKTPEAGTRRVEPHAFASVDLESLGAQIAATREQAKANDPRELRARIRDLEAELRKRPEAAPAKVERVEVPVIDAKTIDRVEALAGRLLERLSIGGELKEAATALRDAVSARFRTTAPVPAVARQRPKREPSENGSVGGVAQRILDALAELEQLGALAPQRELAAFLAGYTNVKSDGFVKAIGSLRTSGFVDYPSTEQVALTDAGKRHAQPPERPRSSSELQARICAMLGGASSQILRPLIDAYPSALERHVVAAAAGYGNVKSAGFVKALGRLRTLGFVDYPDTGHVVAKPVLFLEP